MTSAQSLSYPFPLMRSLVAATVLSLAPAARADDIAVTLSLDAVRVYPVGAEVTRRGPVTLPAGTHRLLLDGLPAQLDPARLVLGLNDSTVRLGSLELDAEHLGNVVGAAEQQLRAQLESLQDERQAVVDGREGANTQLKLLDAVAAGAGGDEPLSAEDLAQLLGAVLESANAARAAIRAADQELRSLDRRIEQVRFELQQVATRRTVQNRVTVAVEVPQGLTTELSLQYPVDAAAWTWLYEARLDTQARQLTLQRRVSVVQTTGEDWSDVELTLTTARVSGATETPPLGPLLVDLQPPLEIAYARASRAEVADALMSTEAGAPAFDRQFVDVSATQYLVEFRVPGRVSVAADSQPRVLSVDQRALSVELVTRAVPERDLAAYLEARFTFAEDVPLQAGQLQLYRDGAFIGRRQVADFQPGAEVTLGFGRDERVQVEVIPAEEGSREGSLLRRSAVDDRRQRFRITSSHADPVAVAVLARLPVSQNASIEVTPGDGATPYTERDVDGQPGLVLWRNTLRPNQPLTLNHFYRIAYPQDAQLWFDER